MKYFCRSCNEWFDSPDTENRVEPHGETWTLEFCPYCRSDDITEVYECKCGNGCSGTNEWCDDCHDKIGWWLDAARKDLNVSLDELGDLIAEHFGW